MFQPSGVPIQPLDPGTHNQTEYRGLLLLPEEHGSHHLTYGLHVDLGDVLTGNYVKLRRSLDRLYELMEDAAMWYITRDHHPTKLEDFWRRMGTLERLTHTLEVEITNRYRHEHNPNITPPPTIANTCRTCRRRYVVRPGESRDYHDCGPRVDQVSGHEPVQISNETYVGLDNIAYRVSDEAGHPCPLAGASANNWQED